jgi:hypothetical protein
MNNDTDPLYWGRITGTANNAVELYNSKYKEDLVVVVSGGKYSHVSINTRDGVELLLIGNETKNNYGSINCSTQYHTDIDEIISILNGKLYNIERED